MRTNSRRFIDIILLSLSFSILTSCNSTTNYSSGPATQQQNVRKVPAMSIAFHKKVQSAQEAMDAGDLEAATEILNIAELNPKINNYERATLWQFRAMIAFENESTPDTIKAYEKILTYRDSIPVMLEQQIIYGLSQLYFSVENYARSLDYLNLWQKTAAMPEIPHHIFMAQVHYTVGNYADAAEYMDFAIQKAKTQPSVEIKKHWITLLVLAHYEAGNTLQAKNVLFDALTNLQGNYHCALYATVLMETESLNSDEALARMKEQFPICNDVTKPEKLTKTSVTDLMSSEKPTSKKTSSEPRPLVRVQPQYPRKAYTDGIEGKVIVEFSVTPKGTVDKESIVIIDANPAGHFEEAAIRAVTMFKYRPKVVDGIPRTVAGVRYSFTFEIAD